MYAKLVSKNRTKGEYKCCVTRLAGTYPEWWWFFLVMIYNGFRNCGFLSMIPKLYAKIKNGTQTPHHVQKKAKMIKSKIKSILIWFSRIKGLCIRNLCLEKEFVSVQVTTTNTWVLLHDNAPCYTKHYVTEFWSGHGNGFTVPHFPNLSPFYAFFFSPD